MKRRTLLLGGAGAVGAITRDLFTADSERHYANLVGYQTPEFPLVFARDAD